MTFTDEEQALHTALVDATIGQPAMPVDRIAAVRRRHTRRRAAQSVTAAVAVVAAVAGTVATTHLFRGRPVVAADRPVPSWALPWPDHRNGSVPQHVLDGAVTAWRHLANQSTTDVLPAPTSVTWYVGQTVDKGSQVAVVFEVDGAAGHRLVAGFAQADQVMDGQPAVTESGSPWVVYDVPAPDRSFDGFIGLNLAGTDGGEGNFHNWVVAVTAPRPQPVRLYVDGGAGYEPLVDGLTVFDAGLVRDRVVLALTTSSGRFITGGPVSVPGSPDSAVPQLEQVGPLTGVTLTPSSLGEATGQGPVVNQASSVRRLGATTIYARCYGPSAIRVAIDDDRTNAGVKIPCDDQQHEVAGPALKAHGSPFAHGHGFTVNAGHYTAWRVAVVVH
jgi:hypothetical protein